MRVAQRLPAKPKAGRGQLWWGFATAGVLMALASHSWAEAPPVPDEAAAVVVGGRAMSTEQLQALVNRSAPPMSSAKELTRWLREQLVPELRLSRFADKTLNGSERYRTLENEALAQAVEHALLASATANPASSGSVAAHYDRFRDRFERPEAVLIWRALLPSLEQAEELRRQVSTSQKATETWKQLVRERSLDEATRQRSGSVGFVHADGRTDVPQVRVSPVLFETASKLRDGDLAPQPVKEGEHWAVVWRRGTRKASSTSQSQARPEIEQHLALQAAREARVKLIERLRSEHLHDYNPNLLEAIQYPTEPGLQSARISTTSKPAEQDPQPKPGDRGDR